MGEDAGPSVGEEKRVTIPTKTRMYLSSTFNFTVLLNYYHYSGTRCTNYSGTRCTNYIQVPVVPTPFRYPLYQLLNYSCSHCTNY